MNINGFDQNYMREKIKENENIFKRLSAFVEVVLLYKSSLAIEKSGVHVLVAFIVA